MSPAISWCVADGISRPELTLPLNHTKRLSCNPDLRLRQTVSMRDGSGSVFTIEILLRVLDEYRNVLCPSGKFWSLIATRAEFDVRIGQTSWLTDRSSPPSGNRIELGIKSAGAPPLDGLKAAKGVSIELYPSSGACCRGTTVEVSAVKDSKSRSSAADWDWLSSRGIGWAYSS